MNEMFGVYKSHIKPNTKMYDDAYALTSASAKLYNLCVGYINDFYKEHDQLFFLKDDGKKQYIYKYTYLYHKFKESPEFRVVYEDEYINTKILKHVFIQVDNIFSNLYKALKSYHKDKSKFKGKPQFPKVKKLGQLNSVTIPLDAYSIVKKKGYATISRTCIKIGVKDLQRNNYSLREMKITPCSYGMKVTILYVNDNVVEINAIM